MKKILILAFIAVLALSLATMGISCKEEAAPEEETVEEVTEEAVEEAAEETTEEAEEEAEEVVEEGNFLGEGSLKYDLDAEVNGGEPITVNIWHHNLAAQDWVAKWTAEYTKIHPNVTFEEVWIDAQTLEKLGLALADGDADIFFAWNAAFDITLPNTEPFPEDVFPLDEMRDDYLFIDSSLSEDGKLYNMFHGAMTAAVLYNKTMWADAGLTEADFPKTWDEMVEKAKLLTQKDDDGKSITVGWSSQNYMEFVMWDALMYQQGSYLFAPDGKANINTPEGIKAAQTIYDWYYKDEIADASLAGESWELFGSGIVGMHFAFGWEDGFLKGTYPDLDFGSFAIPTYSGDFTPAIGRNNVDGFFSVGANTTPEKKAVAFDFIKFCIVQDECMLENDLAMGVGSFKKSLAGDPAFAGSIAETAAPYLDRTVYPGNVSGDFWAIGLRGLYQNMILGNVAPSEAMAQLQADMDANLPLQEAPAQTERKYEYADEMMQD